MDLDCRPSKNVDKAAETSGLRILPSSLLRDFRLMIGRKASLTDNAASGRHVVHSRAFRKKTLIIAKNVAMATFLYTF